MLKVSIELMPTVIFDDGYSMWYANGQMHRNNDLPAITHTNGDRYWCQYGLKHRDNDLPAVMLANVTYEWYINGVFKRAIYNNFC